MSNEAKNKIIKCGQHSFVLFVWKISSGLLHYLFLDMTRWRKSRAIKIHREHASYHTERKSKTVTHFHFSTDTSHKVSYYPGGLIDIYGLIIINGAILQLASSHGLSVHQVAAWSSFILFHFSNLCRCSGSSHCPRHQFSLTFDILLFCFCKRKKQYNTKENNNNFEESSS